MSKIYKELFPVKLVYSLLIYAIGISNIAIGQNNFTISGKISDAKNGEGMIGVNVYLKELKIGTSTNVYGFYSITAPKGKYTLTTSYIGYNSVSKEYVLEQNQTLNIELIEEGKLLEEVVITGKEKTIM